MASSSCDGNRKNALCLESCNLGCSSTGCQISEIAQNQNIVLVFSADVDPASVNSSTIRFRTASGETPVGDFYVNGSVVEFQPQVLVVGGTSFFGFRAGETYTMTLPGGKNEVNAVRSTAGDPLESTLSCSLNVSLGIVDLNQVPPSATLVSPSAPPGGGSISNVPRDVVIQLRFNELIDVTPFQNTNAGNGPVVFGVRRTRRIGSVRECDPTFVPVPLSGSPRVDSVIWGGQTVSVVTLRPAQNLPANICVQILVTDRVRDLSGKSASPQTFEFQTVSEAQTEVEIAENFDDQIHFDRDASSGEWGNGVATFGAIGGDGRHGSFSTSLGTDLGVIAGKRLIQINTDQTIIPGDQTLSGSPIAVTDGEFFFTDMVVPADVRLVFTGTHAPMFHVRGKLEIQGEIDISGASNDYFAPSNTEVQGQPGAVGGPFGGAGGHGGNKCFGTGAQPAFNGQDGEDCRVLAGHGYATAVIGTGGRGSSLFPTSGLNSSIVFASGTINYCIQSAAGGAGGGLYAAGANGRVISNNHPDPVTHVPPRRDFFGPEAPGGIAMQLFPVPAGARSSRHFLVGGSGGGGGGSHPLFANNFIVNWVPGNGGGGGGGAIGLYAGDSLTLTQNAQILARGGSAGRNESAVTVGSPQSAPGGGGSGGSVVLQAGRVADIQGAIDLRGGSGGYVDRQTSAAIPVPSGGRVITAGGDGSPGFVRLEVPGSPTPGLLANVQPPPPPESVAALTELDPKVGFMSKFYSTGQPLPPEFARYVIEARVDGNPVKYSDDPAYPGAVGPARFGLAPIQAYFQSVHIDLGSGNADPNTLQPWRENVGFFASPGLAENGFRFAIVLDRSAGQTVEIEKVSIFYLN